jgi:hypothetical protein
MNNLTRSFLLDDVHAPVALVPAISTHSSGLTVGTGCTNSLLLVIGVLTTAAAANVGGLLTLAHGRSTFTHVQPSVAGRPALRISGLSPPYGRGSEVLSLIFCGFKVE